MPLDTRRTSKRRWQLLGFGEWVGACEVTLPLWMVSMEGLHEPRGIQQLLHPFHHGGNAQGVCVGGQSCCWQLASLPFPSRECVWGLSWRSDEWAAFQLGKPEMQRIEHRNQGSCGISQSRKWIGKNPLCVLVTPVIAQEACMDPGGRHVSSWQKAGLAACVLSWVLVCQIAFGLSGWHSPSLT